MPKRLHKIGEVRGTIQTLTKALRKGEPVELPGVGKLVAREKVAVSKAQRESR